MSTYNTSVFNDLYEYSKSGGTMAVVPDLPTLRNNVSDGFKEIFGPTFSTDPETPAGMLVDSIALMMYNTLGAIVQNSNGQNMDVAFGEYLDALGRIFGLERYPDEDDDSFRLRILNSQARGIGTVRSVNNALSALTAIDGFCVLENNTSTPKTLPEGEANAIQVDPHSIYVSVIQKGTDDEVKNQVSQALYETKAAGCGYSVSQFEDRIVTKDITDENTNSVNQVRFTKAVKKENLKIEISIDLRTYSGIDMETDITNAIVQFLMNHRICTVISKEMMFSAISEYGHAMPKRITFKEGEDDEEQEIDSIVVFPDEYIDPEDVSITVE